MTPVHVLLSGCIDYAGMFPPAGLDLEKTVKNYASCRASPFAWALGTLILPVEKLSSFAKGRPEFASEWPIAAVQRGDVESHVVLRASEEFGGRLSAIECGPLPVSAIARVARVMPSSTLVFIEVGTACDPGEAIAAIAAAGAMAKIRTGGITAAAIPSAERVARFLSCCVQHHVSFKATAGLHHAVRGVQALSYEAGSARAKMHGFLNVLLASALLSNGGELATAVNLLEECSLEGFHFSDEHIRWRDWTFSVQQLREVREKVMLSFGSCSFTEPLDELCAAGLIQ